VSPAELGGDSVEDAKDHWLNLCKQAAVEKDPDKLLELIRKINTLLEERRARVLGTKSASQPAND
jgi:hypothetical protein